MDIGLPDDKVEADSETLCAFKFYINKGRKMPKIRINLIINVNTEHRMQTNEPFRTQCLTRIQASSALLNLLLYVNVY
jgi:hypothetical protein